MVKQRQMNTTILFWDCECDSDYIRLYTENSCSKCKMEQEDAVDSRVDEVLSYLTASYEKFMRFKFSECFR